MNGVVFGTERRGVQNAADHPRQSVKQRIKFYHLLNNIGTVGVPFPFLPVRLDLTQASFRVFERASRCRLPNGSSEIGTAKLLIALFEEEECRAADWLAEAGLSLDMFRQAFGLNDETATLQLPISAPPFAVGSYGISPGQPSATVDLGPPKLDVAAAAGDPPPFPPDYPEPHAAEWIEHEDGNAPPKPAPKTPSEAYSLFTDFHPNEMFEPQRQSTVRFFLDDKPVRIGRLSANWESTLQNLALRIGRRQSSQEKRRPLPSDAALTLPNLEADYTAIAVPLATEHLLLAAALDEGDVGRWLRDHGLEATELLERIEKHSNVETRDHGFEPSKPEIESAEQVGASRGGAADGDHEPRTTNHEPRLHRLLDAVSNRASEAVRVIEDYVRFMLDDRSLTSQLKDFRHAFRKAIEPFSSSERLRHRDTDQDVGTGLEGLGEYERRDVWDVLASNFGRLQESLRSLEEFTKIERPQCSRELERLRYRSYTLHQLVAEKSWRPETQGTPESPGFSDARSVDLDNAKLYVLLDTKPTEEEFTEAVRQLIADGVDVIQLRDKTADDRTLLERAEILRTLTQDSERRVLFVMNDRPDLAVLAAADGVHVGQDELSVAQVRKIVGDTVLVGVSTHNIDQARQAVAEGADYLGVGPVFPSSTKSFAEFPGLEFLRKAAAEIRIPIFAIGGIDTENLPQVLETGVRRVAVGGAASSARPLSDLLR